MYIFPALPKPSYSYDKTEEFNTLINQYASGKESRYKLMRHPKHGFICAYNNIILADRNLLHDFYRQVFGGGDSFWYVDFQNRKWLDEYLGRGIAVAPFSAMLFDSPSYIDYTDEAGDATANDVMLTPASPTSSDAFNFGWTVLCPDVIRINIGTVGATYTLAWQYHRAAGWNAVSNLTDGTNNFRTSGMNDVKFDKPTDADLFTLNGVPAYWVRALISGSGTQAKATQIWAGTRYFDVHGVSPTGLIVYKDGVVQTGGGTDYTLYAGAGEAGADRIKFISLPTVGSLLTTDFTGFLRIKGRLKEDAFQERLTTFNPNSAPFFDCKLNIMEVQW